MPESRLGLHKLNITLLPHTLDCDGEINKDTPDKTVLHSYSDDTVLNKETQQVLRCFWCHQWTLSQTLHIRLQRDVVLWNELTISIMLIFHLFWDERGVIISHIITWNVERTRIMEMTYPDICHVMQCSRKSCVTCIMSELTTVYFSLMEIIRFFK